jgi:nucleoside-diphosphate-sugar epimerase
MAAVALGRVCVHVLVTGGAGFLGSHLAERLLLDGHAVTVVDRFAPTYDRRVKERNLAEIRAHPRARFLELDLARADLSPALEDVTAVAHLAGRTGSPASEQSDFAGCLDDDVLATQRLLEAARGRSLTVFAYASSAAVYGDDHAAPVDEDAATVPHGAHGITKLAGEHLARHYRRVHGVPTLALRYFSVYGPRERPDQVIQRVLTAARDGTRVDLPGDGTEARDFAYVGDVVEGTVAALQRAPVGETFNLARGRSATLSEVLAVVERVTGRRLHADPGRPEPGAPTVAAVITRAFHRLDYVPQVDLETGIRRQWQHVRERRG